MVLPSFNLDLAPDAIRPFVIRFVFSTLISIEYLVQFFCLDYQIELLVPAFLSKLFILLLPSLIVHSYISRVTGIFLSTKMLKQVDESSHPCLTPTVVLNYSPVQALIESYVVFINTMTYNDLFYKRSSVN